MEKLTDLTIVIIAHNESTNLRQLLPLLAFAGRVMVIDNNSTDETAKVAQRYKADYFFCNKKSFAAVRNFALGYVKTPWLFYLDADERVTPQLAKEIAQNLRQPDTVALTLQRQNWCYGEKLTAGGWDRDFVTRIFRLDHFRKWQGDIHESPLFNGEAMLLRQLLWHFTHRDTATNLRKSASWTIKEAALLAASPATPVVTPKVIWRKFLLEFYRRYYRDRGRIDGRVGFVESFVQALNRALVYIQVWELQQQPSLPEKYTRQEDKLTQLWQKEV